MVKTDIIADVSVIIPTYNSSETLTRCLSSVMAQTVKVKEVIVVDDYSGDAEQAEVDRIVMQFADNLNVSLISLPKNVGAGEARNAGVEFASGEYIAFLDSDDVWHPRKIELQYKIMEAFNISLAGHIYLPELTSSVSSADFSPFSMHCLPFYSFALRNPYSTPTIMVKRKKFVPFPKGFRYAEDYICWILNATRATPYFINIPLAAGFKPPVGSGGLSGSMLKMHHGVISGLIYLKKTNQIPIPFFCLAMIAEFIKWPLRLQKWGKANGKT